MRVRTAVFALAASVCASAASATSMTDMPVPLQRTIACMVQVLNATRGIDHVRIAFSTNRSGFTSNNPADNEFWLHPIIEYRVRDKTGQRQDIGFNTLRSRKDTGDSYWFMTVLSGLYDGRTPPSDWRTEEISRKWKARCGAKAAMLFG